MRTAKNLKARQIQISTNKNDSSSLYKELRALYGTPASDFSSLSSNDMNILLRNPDEVKARWREHFSDLLNRRSHVDFAVIEELPQSPPIDEHDNPAKLAEFEVSIRIMNTGKASEKYAINAELLQKGA